MGRPRSRTIKLVLDVSEDKYQTLAVEAHKQGLTVVGLIEKLLPSAYADTPLFPPAEVPPGEVPPVAEVGGFGPKGDLDKYGKRKRGDK